MHFKMSRATDSIPARLVISHTWEAEDQHLNPPNPPALWLSYTLESEEQSAVGSEELVDFQAFHMNWAQISKEES